MSVELISPVALDSARRLLPTGSYANVAAALPFDCYKTNVQFLSGAAAMVPYVYANLGGSVVDIELMEGNVYAAYQDACMEYSYIMNLHQAKNVLQTALGTSTGSFSVSGEMTSGSNLNTKFPKFQLNYTMRVAEGYASEGGFGPQTTMYSASFAVIDNQQDYDLQAVLSSSIDWSGSVGNKKVKIQKVYYKTPYSQWRYYAWYGGLNAIGNLSTYGQYADDSTFEIVPVWQNKLQAINYEDALWTRTSHYSYEIHNNRLRLYPAPYHYYANRIWFNFYLQEDPFVDDANSTSGVDGVNNVNNLPFANLPYESINQIGQHWIKKYCLAICKGMLAQIRGKLDRIPIPGAEVTLNWSMLESQSKEEREKLKTELMEQLKELTYNELSKQESEKATSVGEILSHVPMPMAIYYG